MKSLPLISGLLFVIVSCTPSAKLAKDAKANLLSDAALQKAHVGICIYDPASSQYLFRYQSDKYFIPASNTKLFTMYAALRYLGTEINGMEYVQTDSVLWIRPTGDPTFNHPKFPQQKILNHLQFNSSPEIRIVWPKLLPNPFGSGWQIDDVTDGEVLPRSVFPLTSRSRYQVSVDRMPAIDLTPDMGKEAELVLSALTGKTAAIAEEPAGMIWSKWTSVATDSLLKLMMHSSDNHLAEQILIMAARAKLGYMREDSLISRMLSAELNVLPQKPRWVDGSGVSRYNLFSPEDMVHLLELLRQEFGFERVSRLLPTGGEGTLARLYHDMRGSIFAKTGTLSNNQSLSGYLVTKKGRLLCFSVMLNHYQSAPAPLRLKVESFLREVYQRF